MANLAPSTDVNHIGTFAVGPRQYRFCSVRSAVGDARFLRLPYAARILAENVLRNIGRPGVTAEVLERLVAPDAKPDSVALPLHVPRIILPDSSGIPVLMDLAALQSAVAQAGHDPAVVKAAVPMTLIVDHSLQVDAAGSADAARVNLRAGVRAQPRALPLPEMGSGRVPGPRDLSARQRHHPPGPPRAGRRRHAPRRGANAGARLSGLRGRRRLRTPRW